MRWVIIFSVLIYSSLARANHLHPYSITTVHAEIQDQKIVFKIKTNAEDLFYFHKLEYDSLFKIPAQKLRDAAISHCDVIRSGFYILDQKKIRLRSSAVSADLSSLENVINFDIMSLLKYPLVYTLEFELTETTAILEFHQELGNAGLPAVSFLTISRNANTLAQNIELTKDKPFTMVRDAVSITAPDEGTFMLSYITVSDTRIVHELTIPLALLKSFVAVKDETPAQMQGLIRDFIWESSTVDIDGSILNPEVTALIFQNESISQAGESSMVHLRIEYSLKSLPKEVVISWDAFNWKMRWFKSMMDAFGEKREHNFSRFQPAVKLKRHVDLKRE
jgi:hypothetical protein